MEIRTWIYPVLRSLGIQIQIRMWNGYTTIGTGGARSRECFAGVVIKVLSMIFWFISNFVQYSPPDRADEWWKGRTTTAGWAPILLVSGMTWSLRWIITGEFFNIFTVISTTISTIITNLVTTNWLSWKCWGLDNGRRKEYQTRTQVQELGRDIEVWSCLVCYWPVVLTDTLPFKCLDYSGSGLHESSKLWEKFECAHK